MSESAGANTKIDFSLADHDRIQKLVTGVDAILDKLAGFEDRFKNLEGRMKNVEDWKIRVMAIVGLIGVLVGMICDSAVKSGITKVLR